MSTLPYRAEYAKSGKAACKGCKELIGHGTLRLAIMVQSSFFDGMQPNWYHCRCFFTRTRAKSVDEIAHFQALRWADQEEIRAKVESGLNGLGLEKADPTFKNKGKGKGKKREAASDPSMPKDLLDYTVEYAKSNRSKCKVCEEQIPKGDIRISKKDYEGEVAKKYGPVERWHHVDCFIRARQELNFLAAGTVLPGYLALSPEDQIIVKEKLPSMVGDAPDAPSPPKKPKTENPDLLKIMKRQNEEMYSIRDQLQVLSKKELLALLTHNKQDPPEGVDRILDRLADLMAFGNIGTCPKCNSGTVVFRSGVGYQCTGYVTDWSKCEQVYDKPKRTTFKIPKDLKSDYPFLSSYKSKIQDRAFKKSELPEVSNSVATSSAVSVPSKPLSGLEFFIHKSDKTSQDIEKAARILGGCVVKKFKDGLAAVISLSAETEKKRPLKPIKQALESDIAVIQDAFFDEVKESSSRDDVIKSFKANKISQWGADISTKLAYDTVDGTKSVYPSKSASGTSSIYKSEMGVKKLTLKGGLYVDPDSKLEKKAHVLRRKDEIFSVVLSLTDVQTQRNSFYKLQVLESDKGQRYWLFRSWGRIGTTIGGNKTEEYATQQDAVSLFESLFEDKTGNPWSLRNSFEKVPGKMMMLDVQQGEGEGPGQVTVDSQSSLPIPVQNLLALIFDIEAMKKTMLEFELDLNKMPLGKLSQKQITSAFSLLTELQTLSRGGADRTQILDRTNRFYTLVPHDCGINNPPILDNDALINQKIDMLNNLLDIEIAYKLLETAGDKTESPIDSHYKKLNAAIVVVDSASSEYKEIEKYVQNTHAATHGSYKLKIEQVFKIDRSGEESRFKKFKKLDNRMLLWHGSRTTNYAGILSQGLRIAPPEAPVTGYMFGKGIYFADMVSKSANYCMTSKKNDTGLLLLCEVALGKMKELTHSDYVTKLPSGVHSVKGVGRTQPNVKTVAKTESGAIIPNGKGNTKGPANTSLLYNEYIVYDPAQVQIQYLVRMKFIF